MRTLALLLALSACNTVAPTPAEPVQLAVADGTELASTTATQAAAATVAAIGQPAPGFTLTDLDGNTHSLSQYAGKTVVLEWFNPGCPYVVHAHSEGPLQTMAQTSMDQGVVWLAINSGAPGKQGHGVETNKAAVAEWNMPNPVLVDEDGAVGRMYGAKTTPHMYVIDPAGKLVYKGGLDNAPRGDTPSAGYRSFTAEAVAATVAGTPVQTPQSQPWGCSVKYGS